MPGEPFTPETAREAAAKSAARRQELARLRAEDPDAYMREQFSAERAALSKELLDAALGRGDWHDLPLEKRLSALTKALEYAVGRPVARRDDPPKQDEAEHGLTIE